MPSAAASPAATSSDAAPAPLTVVLVHGLWHGGWCWDEVADLLRRDGLVAVAPELPLRSLESDVAVVRDTLDAIEGEVLLVGHSYGGAVITAAGAHPAVAELVYLAAFLLDDGESISRVAPELAIAPTRLGEALVLSDDRSEVALDPARAADLLYQRTSDEIAVAAVARLRPAARAVFSGRPEHFAWRDRPSTYAVCADDRTVAPELQRVMAARAGATLEWDCDHCPQASRPADVAALLAGRATTA